MEKQEKLRDIQEKMAEIHREYGLDQRELGKITVIVSTTLLIFAAQTALTFQSASKSAENVNRNLDRVNGIANSDGVESAIGTLKSFQSDPLERQAEVLNEALRSTNSSAETSENLEEEMEENYRLYQWLTLIAILGEVAGITIIYT